MSRVYVVANGLWREESAGFAVDRPYGLGQFLLVRFHSPMRVRLKQQVLHAEPGNCILFAPDYPQWYCGAQGAFINDWMHIEGEEMRQIAAYYGVLLNTILSPQHTRFLPRLFEEIAQERFQCEANWAEAVELMVRQLMLNLGRALQNTAAQFTTAEAEHLPALRELRRLVHEQLVRRWTVGVMAREVGLSPSRFATLYKRFFGVSPVEDLLRARLQRAEDLLTNRSISVGQVAAECGFLSVHYFSHVFHQRTGCAPREYYRRDELRNKN